MLTKTIKLQPNEYTNIIHEFDNHDIIILSGARNSGKSYPTAQYIGNLLKKDLSAKFGYIRMRQAELSTFASWTKDLDLMGIANQNNALPVISYQIKRGKPTAGDIQLSGYGEDGKLVTERVIGKCISLENSADIKSGKYDDFVALVFEEYTRANLNPANEKLYVFNFLEDVMSIFRNRDKKIFLITNNFKTIPLLDRAIDTKTGEDGIFKNPIRYKIFKKIGSKDINDDFMAYLSGETYELDEYKPSQDEFYPIYDNSKFVLYKHTIYPKKYYITDNYLKKRVHCGLLEFMALKNFIVNNSTIEFYYKNFEIEKNFTETFPRILSEITRFVSKEGIRFIGED